MDIIATQSTTPTGRRRVARKKARMRAKLTVTGMPRMKVGRQWPATAPCGCGFPGDVAAVLGTAEFADEHGGRFLEEDAVGHRPSPDAPSL